MPNKFYCHPTLLKFLPVNTHNVSPLKRHEKYVTCYCSIFRDIEKEISDILTVEINSNPVKLLIDNVILVKWFGMRENLAYRSLFRTDISDYDKLCLLRLDCALYKSRWILT